MGGRRLRQQTVAANHDIYKALEHPTQDRPVIFNPNMVVPPAARGPKTVQILVENTDTLDAAHTHGCTLVLNFASSRHLGGGYLHGASAQEEQICYRSTLPNSLKHLSYPWLPQSLIVYSPHVTVFRQSEAEGFAATRRWRVAVVSAAALFRPPVYARDGRKQYFARERDAAFMQTQMRRILRIAALYNHRRIVLGAWGCGAFGGPAHHTALLWNQALLEDEFTGVFDLVVMAVFGDDGNFETFQQIFAQQ